jgi:uncharacterized membrane protein
MQLISDIRENKIQFVHCHKLPHRSFFFRGKQFPVCARCTGMYLGYLTFPFFTLGLFYLNIWISIALVLPALIDGLTQHYFSRESNNYLRLFTGIACGVGSMSLCSWIGKSIALLILRLFN